MRKRTLGVFIIAAALAWAPVLAIAKTPRGDSAPAAFRKTNPCPSTGLTTGACPGWIMDHMKPLVCDGPDIPDNLTWQTVEESRAKDRYETQCWRYYKSYQKPPANLIKRT